MFFRKISQCQVRLNAHGADTYRIRQIGGNVQNLRLDLCHQTAKVGFTDHGIIDAEALSEIRNMRTGHQSYGIICLQDPGNHIGNGAFSLASGDDDTGSHRFLPEQRSRQLRMSFSGILSGIVLMCGSPQIGSIDEVFRLFLRSEFMKFQWCSGNIIHKNKHTFP